MTNGTKLTVLVVAFCFVFNHFIHSRYMDSNPKRHHIESMGISITLPIEWRMTASSPTEARFRFNSRDYSYRKHRIGILIRYEDMILDSDEDTLFKNSVYAVKRLVSTEYENSGETKIDDKRSKWIIYTLLDALKSIQYIFKKNKYSLIINFTSKKEIFPKQIDIFNKIAHTLRFDE